jgi:hypothetical protein
MRITEASEYLGVSINTLKHMADSGQIKCYKTTGVERKTAYEEIEAPVFVTFDIPAALIKEIRDECERSGRNIHAEVEKMLRAYIEEYWENKKENEG